MPFFEFVQNNSGGVFVEDENLSHYVVVEANDAEDANYRAQSLGIYFYGCDDGFDCPCCGDRWSPAWDEEATSLPSLYGQPISERKATMGRGMRERLIVHYLDGRVEKFIV